MILPHLIRFRFKPVLNRDSLLAHRTITSLGLVDLVVTSTGPSRVPDLNLISED